MNALVNNKKHFPQNVNELTDNLGIGNNTISLSTSFFFKGKKIYAIPL